MTDTIDATTGSGGSQPGQQAASTSAPAVSRTHRLSFKSRMLVMWNNARHAQLMRISFSTNSPVWILGEMYHPRKFFCFACVVCLCVCVGHFRTPEAIYLFTQIQLPKKRIIYAFYPTSFFLK